MSKLLQKYSAQFEVRIGRADHGRSFIDVIYIPTGKTRTIVGLGKEEFLDIVARFQLEILKELGLN